jgi:hypothetical protein
MREGTPNRLLTIATVSSLKVVTKSLFRKILATSPYGSRFYADRLISNNGNSNGLRILERYTKKIVGGGEDIRVPPYDEPLAIDSEMCQLSRKFPLPTLRQRANV